jgi:hypothetical protein
MSTNNLLNQLSSYVRKLAASALSKNQEEVIPMSCRPFQVTLAMLVVLALLVTACAPTATPIPTPSPTGPPTATPPPTARPTSTSVPTATPSPMPSGGGTGRIAFTSNRDGNEEIYVMNADGSGQTRLTNNPADDMCPAWQP